MIDLALHDSYTRLAFEEVIAFESAIEVALSMVDLSETLIIVQGDHSHGLFMVGYPERGNDILGRKS